MDAKLLIEGPSSEPSRSEWHRQTESAQGKARSESRSGERSERAALFVAQWRVGGDQEPCFKGLFELYHRPMFCFFANRGFPNEECSDLVQETFLRVFRGLAEFQGKSTFDTWLFAIATNVLRNQLRSKRAGKRASQEVQLDLRGRDEDPGNEEALHKTAGEDPLKQCLVQEGINLLEAALEEMPSQMRRCTVLRLYQGLNHREIAIALDTSVDTVKAQIYKARSRLRHLSSYLKEL